MVIINGCVDPFYLPSISVVERFVVDGEITNEPGPYRVRIFYSRPVTEVDESKTRYETNASVWIEANDGESELLSEIDTIPGTYITNANGIQGEVGKSYRIKIITTGGNHYESSWELLEPAGAINDLYFKFTKDLVAPVEGKVYDSYDGFRLYANTNSSTESSGFLRWRWTGVFSGIASPELHTKFVGRAEVPDPLPCSGYIVRNGLEQVDECTCCLCWAHDYSRDIVVSDNKNVTANTFLNVPIGKVLISKPRFHERYYVELEQLSVSKNLYAFWKLLSDQQKATGSLFQPNSFRIRGNIISTTDPSEEVLGVFSVSAVVKKSLFIEKTDIPYEVGPMDPQNEDCRDSLPNAINTKPDFW